ncbi:Uncharacterised protein [uncultured Eubacterium sp.]|uniref:TetR/AcrR family transcriptional regulator n=1 Tax=Emergencia sp. TaxID=1926557 RepID=UPI0008219E31|nr:Uncharacterised protein [uncultured Eubacterium sp.]
MPPKAKFTKEEIVSAALKITRASGINAVSARAIGAALNSSARPIFTVFRNMEEVQREVIDAAKRLYNEYVRQGLEQKPAFKHVGMQYIHFAVNEPKLFQLLFMSEQKEIPNLSEVLSLIDQNYQNIYLSIMEEYGVDERTAERLYRHLWIYTHGIASLCATKVCAFDESEMNDMLTEVFVGLLQREKQEKEHD